MLVANGHAVTGMTRSRGKAESLRSQGADAVVADALDAHAVMAAVRRADPAVVVHELTAIPWTIDVRNLDRDFELTNRLRTEGTDNLVAAAQEAGAARFVAQSFAGTSYERRGSWVKTEDAPLEPNPRAGTRRVFEAIKHLESEVLNASGLEGIVLRYGGFYGPGTSLGPGGAQVEAVKRRRLPIVGKGTGVWSFIHIEDAASATVAAIERGRPGIYNIVDDDPAPVSEWLPALAEALRAKPPRRVPSWLARRIAGDNAVVWMTDNRGASNAKAKAELGWKPRYASWREGFRATLAQATAA